MNDIRTASHVCGRIKGMSNTQTSSSHGKLIAVVVTAAVVVILALVSAFVWPGWALNQGASNTTTQQNSKQEAQKKESTTPSIDAVALPDDATELLSSMPDSVLNFARTDAQTTTSWQSASPLEEYTVTYSTGTDGEDVTMIMAQWSDSDSAKKQYDALAGMMTGDVLATGSVKVSGQATGSYTVQQDASDANKAIALWQNDTVVFQVTGATDSVERFYQEFPL